tara:strand:+ start:1369 stop:2667 length:1299 start_codon:yes stop_codon:yes gene_type:complete
MRKSHKTLNSGNFYYGWVIVSVVVLSGLASGALINPTIGVFLKPITEEFGWTRSAVAGAVAVGTFVGGFVAIGVGRLIDRYGPKWILTTAFIFAGSAIIYIGKISNIVELYVAIFVMRVALQGAINISNQAVVPKWFVRQRGRALAISNLGMRVGSGVIPFITQQLILMATWRSASLVIGITVWILTIIPITIWMKRRPQDHGLLPDNDMPVTSNDPGVNIDTSNVVNTPERNYTLSEALRSRPFWVITAAFLLTNFVNTGVNFNLFAHLTDNNLTESQAAIVLLVWALIAIPSTLALGLLAEKYSIRLLMIFITIGVGIGIFLMLIVSSFLSGLIFAVFHGACFAGLFLMLQLLVADYYGSASLGTIRGFIFPWQMIANSVGPLAATLVYDFTGSYSFILTVYIVIHAILVIALIFALPSRDSWLNSSKLP